MDQFTSCPTLIWTRDYPFWTYGTSTVGETIDNAGSHSASTTDGGGRTTNFAEAAGETNHRTEVMDGTATSETGGATAEDSAHSENKYTPSTHTEEIPGPATITVTDNVDLSTSNRAEGGTTNLSRSGDTTYQTGATVQTGETNDGVSTGGSFANDGTTSRTAPVAPTGIGSSVGELGFPTITTTATQEDGWTLSAISTSTYTFSRSTTGMPSTTTASSWTTAATYLTLETSQTTEADTTARVTYSADLQTTATRTTMGGGGGTATVPDMSGTTTNHGLSPLQDTVCLMRGLRAEQDYQLGNELWTFVGGAVGPTQTTSGRFTDLFSSAGAATVTIPDYQQFTSISAAITAITVSYDTTETTTFIITGITTTTGTHPPTIATASTNTTVSTTWKNGATWDRYSHYMSGTSHLFSEAASNTSTTTLTFGGEGVSTSLYTEEVGDPPETLSFTQFFASCQVTGYTTSGWTSTSSTLAFGATSTTETYLALNSPATTTQTVDVRSSQTEEILISSSFNVGTDWHFLGMVKTTTTRVFTTPATTTREIWLDEFNPEIEVYATSSVSTTIGAFRAATCYTKAEGISRTFLTEARVLPNTWTFPFHRDEPMFTGLDHIWRKVPPRGYGAVGGNFTLTDMSVYRTVSAGRVAGSAFGTQSFDTALLPTALAYEMVTFFPDRTDFPIPTPAGAVAAKYLSRVSALGDQASIGVTWSSTTVSGTSTLTTLREATYTVGGVSPQGGDFYREEPIVWNTSNARGGPESRGGYALGNNALDGDATVRVAAGYAEWTAWDSESTVSTGSTVETHGSASFTIPGSLAIVVKGEPVLSMSWGEDQGHHFMSSTPYFPTP